MLETNSLKEHSIEDQLSSLKSFLRKLLADTKTIEFNGKKYLIFTSGFGEKGSLKDIFSITCVDFERYLEILSFYFLLSKEAPSIKFNRSGQLEFPTGMIYLFDDYLRFLESKGNKFNSEQKDHIKLIKDHIRILDGMLYISFTISTDSEVCVHFSDSLARIMYRPNERNSKAFEELRVYFTNILKIGFSQYKTKGGKKHHIRFELPHANALKTRKKVLKFIEYFFPLFRPSDIVYISRDDYPKNLPVTPIVRIDSAVLERSPEKTLES